MRTATVVDVDRAAQAAALKAARAAQSREVPRIHRGVVDAEKRREDLRTAFERDLAAVQREIAKGRSEIGTLEDRVRDAERDLRRSADPRFGLLASALLEWWDRYRQGKGMDAAEALAARDRVRAAVAKLEKLQLDATLDEGGADAALRKVLDEAAVPLGDLQRLGGWRP